MLRFSHVMSSLLRPGLLKPLGFLGNLNCAQTDLHVLEILVLTKMDLRKCKSLWRSEVSWRSVWPLVWTIVMGTLATEHRRLKDRSEGWRHLLVYPNAELRYLSLETKIDAEWTLAPNPSHDPGEHWMSRRE